MRRARSTSGFTLVEMIVALFIFAILAGAGVTLLRSSVDTQESVGKALGDLGDAARLRTLFAADLSQAVVRPIKGAPRGFAGSSGGLLLVRTFEPAERRQGASGLQAIRWQVQGDRLTRQSISPDGQAVGPAATMARDVSAVTLRYRLANGGWSDAWAPAPADDPLPRAIELRLQRRGQAEVSILIALPEGPRPPSPPGTPV